LKFPEAQIDREDYYQIFQKYLQAHFPDNSIDFETFIAELEKRRVALAAAIDRLLYLTQNENNDVPRITHPVPKRTVGGSHRSAVELTTPQRETLLRTVLSWTKHHRDRCTT